MPESTIIISAKDRDDECLVDLLRSARKSVFICVHSLDDPMILGEIERERQRGIKVVVSMHPMKEGAHFHGTTVGPGEMIVDATWEWFGSRDWSLDRYTNSSAWFELPRKDQLAWQGYFQRAHP
jgi:hypothetical protein